MILAGDIGGTNTRLALFDETLQPQREDAFRNAGRAGLQEIVREFLNKSSAEHVSRACFGVAGPVANGEVLLTNLSWHLSERNLSHDLGIPQVALINDLMAHAEGIATLKPDKLVVLNEGKHVAAGNRAIIAPGTGLGEAGLFWDAPESRYLPFPSEGGHCDFGPRTPQEIDLLRFLQRRIRNVTWESVLSGPGLRNLYDFLCTPEQLGPAAALPQNDPPPTDITSAALAGTNPACVAALDLFVHLCGAEAGNLALKLLSVGGIYVGGGIAPHIIPKLQSPVFLASFRDKGPAKLRPLLEAMPVYAINFDRCGLYGAANHASRL